MRSRLHTRLVVVPGIYFGTTDTDCREDLDSVATLTKADIAGTQAENPERPSDDPAEDAGAQFRG